jgi:hypothetical protein
MTTENIIFIEEIIVILLLIASGVAVAARCFRVPYTVGLGHHRPCHYAAESAAG